jgi:hypothetical protein
MTEWFNRTLFTPAKISTNFKEFSEINSGKFLKRASELVGNLNKICNTFWKYVSENVEGRREEGGRKEEREEERGTREEEGGRGRRGGEEGRREGGEEGRRGRRGGGKEGKRGGG